MVFSRILNSLRNNTDTVMENELCARQFEKTINMPLLNKTFMYFNTFEEFKTCRRD